ncbi:MAG TPA: exonuclease subunit SbcD [Flavobacterium sp.]|nr:exonuclease subunit SbcD [Flavobacterium sp.]
MKILHTADWHLGKKLDGISRMKEQIEVLDEIVDIADREAVDMVLIAGDLFDNFTPNTEAVELFYKTLKRLSNNGKRPVVAISGNHDAPNFIDAPDPLARECGIILIGHPNAAITPFELEHFKIVQSDEGFIELKIQSTDFPVRLIHTPYANEMRLKRYLGEDKADELNQVLAQHWNELAERYCDDQGVNLLTTHLYMNKRGGELLEEPDGEKPLKIGNADMIYSSAIPQQIQYTALGHIHSFKNVGTENQPVVYSSSPLCYSFSEAGQTKYVAIIEAFPNQNVSVQKTALTKGKPLYRKTFDSVDKALEWLTDHPDTLVELTLESDTFLKTEERKLLYQSHEGIVHLIPKIKRLESANSEYREVNLNQNIKELFQDYFKTKHNNQQPNQEMMDLFDEVLKE